MLKSNKNEDLNVLVVGYNRPDLIQNVLTLLHEFGLKKVYVSIDGPKLESDEVLCNQVRDVVENFSSKFDLKIKRSQENLGCCLGVVSAIDWFFSECTSGIVLEDDISPTGDFFQFVIENAHLLESNDQKIGWISGYTPLSIESAIAQPIKIAYPMIWGWYSTSGVWSEIRRHYFRWNFPNLRRPGNGKISIPESFFWWASTTRVRLGIHDTWDSLFLERLWKCGYQGIVPSKQLVENTGFRVDATHTYSENKFIPISIQLEEVNEGDLDEMIKSQYFGIKLRHILSSPIGVFLDLRKVKFKNFERILNTAHKTSRYES